MSTPKHTKPMPRFGQEEFPPAPPRTIYRGLDGKIISKAEHQKRFPGLHKQPVAKPPVETVHAIPETELEVPLVEVPLHSRSRETPLHYEDPAFNWGKWYIIGGLLAVVILIVLYGVSYHV